MGQSKKSSTNTLALQIDSDGRVRYDAIAKQGHGKDKVVHSKFNELLPAEIKSGLDPDLARPDEEEVQQVTEKTKAALEKVVNSKIAAAMPTHVPEQSSGAQYIRLVSGILWHGRINGPCSSCSVQKCKHTVGLKLDWSLMSNNPLFLFGQIKVFVQTKQNQLLIVVGEG
jgi:hypothetical protein